MAAKEAFIDLLQDMKNNPDAYVEDAVVNSIPYGDISKRLYLGEDVRHLDYAIETAITLLGCNTIKGLGHKAATKFASTFTKKMEKIRNVPSQDLKLLPAPLNYANNNSKAQQLRLNNANGRAFQISVHDWLRIPENKQAFNVLVVGKGQILTIPDLAIQHGVTEIKSVRYISFTKQLQAQVALAKQKGTSFNLIISPTTKNITKPLSQEIYTSGGKVFEFNPITQNVVERFIDDNKVLR